MISVSGKSATIAYSNDTSNDYVRGFKTVNSTKKAGGTCDIVMNSAASNGGSVMGYMFGETNSKDSDGATVYSFYILAVRYNSGIQYYLSYFKNVKESELTGSGTSFGTETTIWKGSSTAAYATASDSTLSNGTLKVTAVVSQTSGAYTVTLTNAASSTQIATTTFNAITYNTSLTASTNEQGLYGFYANVYKSYALNGSWALSSLAESNIVDTVGFPEVQY